MHTGKYSFYFRHLSPSLSEGELKTWRTPMFQTIFLYSQFCLGEFKKRRNCLQVKKVGNKTKRKEFCIQYLKNNTINFRADFKNEMDSCMYGRLYSYAYLYFLNWLELVHVHCQFLNESQSIFFWNKEEKH